LKDKLRIFSIALGVVTLISVIGGVFLVIAGQNEFRQKQSDTAASRNDVIRFYGKNPFPSKGNTDIEVQNAQLIESVGYRGLNDLLRAHDIQPMELTPGRFKDFLSSTLKLMREYASERQIQVDPEFPFGFGQYTGTEIPSPQDVPRLTQQLQIVSNICMTLFDAGITELESVERERFEGVEGSASSAGGGALINAAAGMLQKGQLFVPWRFRVSFNAKEGAILGSLNGFNRQAALLKVNSVSTRSLSLGVSPPKYPFVGQDKPQEVDSTQPERLSPNERLVSGGVEPILPVRMDLSVYQFAETQIR